MLFISNAQYYVPVKFCRTAGSIYVFIITGAYWIKKKYTLQCYRIRLERSQYDFELKWNKSASSSHYTT